MSRAAALLLVLALSACATVDGIGQDISTASRAVEDAL
ncbi:entericidin EcnA/B family protein [Pseudoruegeria sp. SHC-113]|nr:entericidin EcnA/B family protein [Pseudoruegeria sp. SHC-113]MCT8160451.1 entericidin EcnA/B family protein [Pseudoruegeria sp. SHC-113]